MAHILTRKLINRGLTLSCRNITFSSLRANANTEGATSSCDSANAQSIRKTALYDFHVKNFGRM